MTALTFHPLATIFPPIEGDDFSRLVEDIRAHGIVDTIVLLDDQVLEGRNRYRALQRLVETGEVLGDGWGHRAGQNLTDDALEADNIWFKTFSPDVDGDALAFVISKNLVRRHLNESQRAMVAARLATMSRGARTDLASIDARSDADAAALLNVGEASVERAKAVQRDAVPALAIAVERGNIAVSAAAEMAALPVERQTEIVASLPRDEQGRLTPEAKKALAPIIKEVRAEKQAEKRERRDERERDLAGKQQALPDKRYGVILADPEWRFEPYSRDSGMDRAADNHYPTSLTEVIASRPVAQIAATDCALFLWATAPMLPDAFQVMEAWGFTYRSQVIWSKDRLGTGYWFRNKHELLLLGIRGNVPAPAQGLQWDSLIQAAVSAHSAKPDRFYGLIEAYFPNLPKIELNARRVRPGWDAWGLEAPESQANATDGKAGMAGVTGPVRRSTAGTGLQVGESGAALTATSEFMDVTAGETAPIPATDDVLEIPAFLRRNPDNSLPTKAS